jgi:methionyl-tRNA synthetase
MIGKNFSGQLTDWKGDTEAESLLQKISAACDTIAGFYEKREFGKAVSLIRELAEESNVYFDAKAPWKTLASSPEDTQKVLTVTINAFRKLAIYLKPILPKYTAQVEKLLNEKPYSWSDSAKVLANSKINSYEHLAGRIDPVKVEAMVEESKKAFSEKSAPAERNAEKSTEISIDDFAKLDLRVAEIIEAEEIKEADKLLRLKVSLGPMGERQIIAGIKSAYKAEDLKGRKVLVIANLAPRKMKFGMSEGMVLAAGSGGADLFVLSPDDGAKAGDKVK